MSRRFAQVRTALLEMSLHDVHQALLDLTQMCFGDVGVEDAIKEIVQTTHTIFAVDGAGLMLTDDDRRLRVAAASDDRFGHLEELQLRHHEGPCIDAFEDKVLVSAQNLADEQRWPAFSQAAVDRSVCAVLASPLPYNRDAVGVVAVLSERRRPWPAEAELGLLAFTDLAALLIASMMHGEEQSQISVQLQAALDSRQVIEQAKGVLIAQQGIPPRAAYEQLRAQARAGRRKLNAVCAEVVAGAARDS
jgi:hypothetical protein